MNPEQRRDIADAVRYLRSIRPIDPAEIVDYVDDAPHPAVVRETCRELAPALDLVEREDGTFEPVSEEPLSPLGGPVTAFPNRYAEGVEETLVDRFGVDWASGDGADRLRDRLATIKERYLSGLPVEYDDVTAVAYALYHLPDYYATMQYVLDDLAREDLLGRSLRVLDVGAGVGGPALGIADFCTRHDDAILEYHAVEPSEAAADLLESMLALTDRNVHASVHRERSEDVDLDAMRSPGADLVDDADHDFDVVCFANVLNELEDPVPVVERALDVLAPDGSLIAIAPADRETSVGLREIERSIETADGRGGSDGDTPESSHDVTIHSPTVRLWPGFQPTDESWSFDVKPDLDVPGFQESLDDGSGEFVNVDVQFSHFVARLDGRRRVDLAAEVSRWARMADADDHVTDRVDCLAAKLSHDLSDGGNPLFKVSDGSERRSHFAVLVEETSLNRSLPEAGYGDVLAIENVLVLWNDDEAAYNLVVDEETTVDVARRV
jgi:SAM-dependent methyltransferase